MGDKKPPKHSKPVKLLAEQVEFLDYLKEKLGVKHYYQAFEHMMRACIIVESFMERVGVKSLTDFSHILDEFLPTSPEYLKYRALTNFQDELRRAGVEEGDIEYITELIIEAFAKIIPKEAKQ